jgi:hypothetical protein
MNEETLAYNEQRRADMRQRAEYLMSRYEALERAKGPERQTSTAVAACDAAMLADRGLDEALRGRHGEALRLYEASLACEFQPQVARQALFSACQAKDSAHARIHYAQFSNDPRRDLVRRACASYGVDLPPSPPGPEPTPGVAPLGPPRGHR